MDIEYFTWKYKKIDLPSYKLVMFDTNKPIMEIAKHINTNGLCLVDVVLFKHSNDDTQNILVTALIDSGAAQSVISKRMADGLSLQLLSQVQVVGAINGAAGTTQVNVAIQSFATKRFDGLGVIIHKGMEGDFDFIIGADILAHFIFERNGPNNTFTLKLNP